MLAHNNPSSVDIDSGLILKIWKFDQR